MSDAAPKPKAATAVARGTNALQSLVERIILYSRYLLVVFYIGLAFALAIYAISYLGELVHFAEVAFTPGAQKDSKTSIVMLILELIDGVLIAGLIVMVMLSSYENFVGRFGEEHLDDSPEWLRRLDHGSLKLKVATALLIISAVQLLQVFLELHAYTEQQIFWKVVIHLVFVASALFLGILDRITDHSDQPKGGH